MASGERIYAWVVLVAVGLPALFRLSIPRKYAELQSEKLSNPRSRKNQVRLGLVALLASPLILLYVFYGPLRTWMWLAVIVGVLSGIDQVSAPWFHQRRKLVTHTIVFGACGAAASVLIYFFLLRH